jgi:hypothetical protein
MSLGCALLELLAHIDRGHIRSHMLHKAVRHLIRLQHGEQRGRFDRFFVIVKRLLDDML